MLVTEFRRRSSQIANGPLYSSKEFGEFAKDYGFRHITSSPYYPQGNGEAERAVGTINNPLKKGDDPYKSLLAYRSTPLHVGYSPSQLLMGRVHLTNVPTTELSGNLKFRTSPPCRQKIGGTSKDRRETHNGARGLSPSQSGDRVWVPKRKSEAEVQEEVAPQSFTVNSEDGTYRRNRQHLIRLRRPAQLKRVNREKRTKLVNRMNRVHHPGCEGATVLHDRPSDLTHVCQTELAQNRNSLCDLCVCMFGCMS